ncbi:hypothetical protein EYB25_000110 [Talaromyces marneffei]|nr:hypothetical protein EYB25_000110 [Talaromyces marneffei]
MPPESGFHRLRRAKSAPSVQKRRQAAIVSRPLESEVDRHHATTAASLAMAQAKDRTHAPQKTTAFSSGNPETMPSARALYRHPSLSSLTRDAISTGPGYSIASNVYISSHQAGDKTNDSSPLRVPSIPDLQGFGVDGDLSAPSSFRRLRKSRSMLTTKSMRNLRAAEAQASHSEETESPSLRRSTDSTSGPHRSLRHSLSFFNGSIRRMKSQGVLSTRRQHLSKIENEPPVPPLTSSTRDQPARKPMRTTVRTMREYSPDDDTFPTSNGGKHHSKARSFSISIKKRLKRVFGIPSYDESQPLSYDSNLVFESPALTEDALRPSLHSTRSSESLATSASRVTSWTNSTAGNTVRTRYTMGHQSLSTIEEGYDFADKLSSDDTETYESDNVGNRYNVIDSQRVYSALMRHIGETAVRDGERAVSTGAIKGSPVIVERSPSVRTLKNHSSIHKVPSDLSMKTARTSFTVERRPQSSQSQSILRSPDYTADSPVTPIWADQVPQPSPRSSSRVNVRDSKPAFSPSGSSPRLKTPSPYKASMSSIREITDDSDMYTPRINIVGSDNDMSADLDSPSIYSRTPSGRAASRDALDDGFEEPFEPGMATIYDVQVPYKSPRRQDSSAIEPGPRNSAEWKEWVNYQMNNLDIFEAPKPVSQREHHREDAEYDGRALPQESAWDIISSYAAPDKKKSFNRFQQSSTYQQDLPGTDFKALEQNNFSRPISRQSMGSLHETTHEAEPNHLGIQRNHPADPFSSEKPYSLDNAPSRRQAIRAAREARLNRGMPRRNRLNLTEDQPGAKAVQFRSIREVPSICKRNKENEMSPSVRDRHKGTGLSKLEDLPQMRGGSKRMVDDFILGSQLSRRSPDSVTSGNAFV